MDDAVVGEIDWVAPNVRRVLAPNPSPFTYTGTQTFIVGTGEVAVIDPGPDIPAHVEVLLEATRDERIAAIVCTHTHRDHSPASRALKRATGAPIVGCAALAITDQGPRTDESFDPDYVPDRVLGDADTVSGPGWTLEAVATPGHTSNHICLALVEAQILFSGDHVMAWATSIVSPPDGDMGDYLASLRKLLDRRDDKYFPAHGPEIKRPHDRVRWLLAHRRERETQILRHLAVGMGDVPLMVSHMYDDIDPGLHPAAERSVLAHLLDMEHRGMVERRGDRWVMIV